MRILTGQAIADAGQIEVLGYQLPAESKLARARMGVGPQESNLDIDLCVRDVLSVFARLTACRSRPRGRTLSTGRSRYRACGAGERPGAVTCRAGCSAGC